MRWNWQQVGGSNNGSGSHCRARKLHIAAGFAGGGAQPIGIPPRQDKTVGFAADLLLFRSRPTNCDAPRAGLMKILTFWVVNGEVSMY